MKIKGRSNRKFLNFCAGNYLSTEKDIDGKYIDSRTFYAEMAWKKAWQVSQVSLIRNFQKKGKL